MTKFFLRFSGLAFVLALLIATGCSEDDPIIDNPIGPQIALSTEAGFVSSDIELLVGEPFSVKVTGTPGDNLLETLSLAVDGVQPKGTELSNYVTGFFVDGAAETAQNPQLLVGAVKNGATWQYDLAPFGMMEGDISTFTFTVADESSLTASISFDVTIVPPPGTPVDTTLTGILFNQAGDAGRGALDLDAGYTTGVTTSGPNADPIDAEIRDLGLDCTVPAPGFNWRRQIGTVNGADLRQVDLSKVENFTFDNVTTVEEIIGAYDTGIEFNSDEATNCSNGNTSSVTDVTDVLEVGDMFVVVRDDKYYLIRIDAITETEMDNDDEYEISIKY